MGKKIGQALKRSIEMDSLMTPGMPGYKMPKQSLYDRLFKKRRATLDPLDLDKEEFPEANAATNLNNYAINQSFDRQSLLDRHSINNSLDSEASSVSNDQIYSKAPNLYETIDSNPLKSDGNFFYFYPESENDDQLNLFDRPVRKLDRDNNLIDYPSLGEYYSEMERTKPPPLPPFKENFSYSSVQDLENSLKMDNLSLQKPNPLLKLPNAKTHQDTLKESSRERLSRQNSPEQPYPDNWNPQANASANRSWGAQNLANRQAEIAQSGSNVAGLGGRGVQAAENTLPQAVARAGGVSSFASRALPVISLGLFASSLYSNAKANRENEQRKKMIEGNQI